MANGRRAFWTAIAITALTALPAYSQSGDAREQPENSDAAVIAWQCIKHVQEQSSRLGSLVKRCGESDGAWQRIVQAVVDAQLEPLRGGQDCKITHVLEGGGVVKLSGKAADPKKTLGEAQTMLRGLPSLSVDASDVKADDCQPKRKGDGFDFPLDGNGLPREIRRGDIDGVMAGRLPGESDCEVVGNCEGGCGGAAAKEAERQFASRYSQFWIAAPSGAFELCKKLKGKWAPNKNVAQETGLLVLRATKN